MQSLHSECQVYRHRLRESFFYPLVRPRQSIPQGNVISILLGGSPGIDQDAGGPTIEVKNDEYLSFNKQP